MGCLHFSGTHDGTQHPAEKQSVLCLRLAAISLQVFTSVLATEKHTRSTCNAAS